MILLWCSIFWTWSQGPSGSTMTPVPLPSNLKVATTLVDRAVPHHYISIGLKCGDKGWSRTVFTASGNIIIQWRLSIQGTTQITLTQRCSHTIHVATSSYVASRTSLFDLCRKHSQLFVVQGSGRWPIPMDAGMVWSSGRGLLGQVVFVVSRGALVTDGLEEEVQKLSRYRKDGTVEVHKRSVEDAV